MNYRERRNWPKPGLIDVAVGRMRSAYRKLSMGGARKASLGMGYVKSVQMFGRDGVCHTYACFAGWYNLAVMDGDRSFLPVPDTHSMYTLCDADGSVHYTTGAEAFARDIGVGRTPCGSYADSLEEWAGTNPDIWGNTAGHLMFVSGDAYGPNHRDGDLDTALDHWRDVADRIRNAE